MQAHSTFVYGDHVRINGIRQHYLRYGGKGRPLVLIPGITTPAILWGFVAEILGTQLDVHVLDVRGRGLSESGDHLGYGLNDCATDLVEFCKALDLADAVWLGHSMGARIAARAAALDATHAGLLILADPPVSGPGRRAYPVPLNRYLDTLHPAALGLGYEAMKDTPWAPSLVRLRAEWMHTCYEPAIVAAWRSFHEDDIHQDLRSSKRPIRVMAAERGGVIQAPDIEELLSFGTHIQVEKVADCGHMMPFENLPNFLGVLGRFLGLDFPAG
ncbi:MAG: alpha/beta hydrolase [Burkholderiales bacterium]|nr:alpha/beta hydrolase [Burkholderiales bacterium]